MAYYVQCANCPKIIPIKEAHVFLGKEYCVECSVYIIFAVRNGVGNAASN